MSSSAYIFPYNPDAKADTHATVAGVDVNALWASTPAGESPPKVGTTRTFFNTPPSKVTTLSSLGDKFASKPSDAKRELIRKSIGNAVKDLKAIDGIKELAIDPSADPHAAGKCVLIFQPALISYFGAAVAAHLALYKFSLKTSPPSRFNPNLKEPIPEKISISPLQTSKEWERGTVYANAQNLARTVCRMSIISMSNY
jgi:aminopeptidase